MIREKRELIVVVLSILILLLWASFVSADVSGCYVYPQTDEDLYCVEGVLQSEAQQDCEQYADCDINDYFIPGSDCQNIPECEVIICTVDCQTHARGICEQQLQGAEVTDYDVQCSLGCCKISTLFCQFNLNEYQCQQKAAQLGVPWNQAIFDNAAGMNLQQCQQQY